MGHDRSYCSVINTGARTDSTVLLWFQPRPQDWGLALSGWTRIKDAASDAYLPLGCVTGSREG